MKQWELEQAQTQIVKIRRSLNDEINPPDKIKRPRYPCGRLLEQKRFNNRVRKLKTLEKRVDNLLENGLLKWFNRVYKP